MYKPIGYTAVPVGRYLPQYAGEIVTCCAGALESEIGECIKKLGSDRNYVSNLTVLDLLRMSSPRISEGSEEWKKLIHFMVKMLNHAGYLAENVDIVTYSDSPLMTAREAVGNMLTDRLPFFTKDQYGGDRATFNTLRTMIPTLLKLFKSTEGLRPDYYQYLRLKLADIGYKLLHSQPIDQAEKTFFLNYCNVEEGSPGEVLGVDTTTGKTTPISAIQNSNPLVIEAFELLKKNTLSGPGLDFYRLMSNQNLESLLFYYGPHVRSLPLTAGYRIDIGPFRRLMLKRVEERSWTESDQLAGIRDKFVEIPIRQTPAATTKSTPSQSMPSPSLSAEAIEWVMNAPVIVCGPEGSECPRFFDTPDVNIRVIDERNIAKKDWEYYSPWRQRMVMSIAGGTSSMYYTDLALANASMGKGNVDKLNMDEFGIVDIDEKVNARELKREGEKIYEKMYYVKKGNVLQSTEVNVTEFYSRAGSIGYKPAFAEFLMPPRSWYLQEDPRASEHIAAQLGLTREETMRNALALTLSHNDAVLKRLAGVTAPFDIEATIKAILNARA